MIDKETILRIARESGFYQPRAITVACLLCDEQVILTFATALLAHRAESGVEVPEWTRMDNLGDLLPSEVRVSVASYGNARAAEALERAAKAAEKWHGEYGDAQGHSAGDAIRSLTP